MYPKIAFLRWLLCSFGREAGVGTVSTLLHIMILCAKHDRKSSELEKNRNLLQLGFSTFLRFFPSSESPCFAVVLCRELSLAPTPDETLASSLFGSHREVCGLGRIGANWSEFEGIGGSEVIKI